MNTEDMLNVQLMIFLLMGVGYFLRKKDIITRSGREVLTDLVLDVFLPCNIITAFMMEMTRELLFSCMEILLISIGIQLACLLINTFCYNKIPRGQRAVIQYGTLCSNAGLIGNPIALDLYGNLGLLYASVYLIPQRIFMWSVGLAYFTETTNKRDVVKKVMTNPCIIAFFIGLILMITQIRLPGFLDKTISSLGSCTTAVSMVFIGAVIADGGLKGLFSKLTVIYSVIRLILIPAAVLLVCYLIRLDAVAAGVAIILAAMPAGATTVVLASKNNGDEVFATKCVVLTTLLSIIFLPVWCIIIITLF